MARYRIFIGAFLEGDLEREIQVVRQRIDPRTAAITPPHVSLAGTYWRSGPPTPQNEAGLRANLHGLAGQIAPFDLHLGGIRTFPGARPVIYLGVERSPGLLAARQALLSAVGMDKHGAAYQPHLTLAMRIPSRRASRVVDELAGTGWQTGGFTVRITTLRLMQRGPADPAWRWIDSLRLA